MTHWLGAGWPGLQGDMNHCPNQYCAPGQTPHDFPAQPDAKVSGR